MPEEYGGSGLPISAAAAVLEEIHKSGCNGGACHAQMYIMGTVLRHGSPSRSKSSFQRSRQVNLDCRHLAFLNLPAEPIRYL